MNHVETIGQVVDSHMISHDASFRLCSGILAVILPPGIINTVTGGYLLAQALPELNGVERFGIAGIGFAAALFFYRQMTKSHDKAMSDKDAELTRRGLVLDAKDLRIKELTDELMKSRRH